MAGPVDRARGQADLPLSAEGLRQAEHLGRRIAAKGGIDTVVTSAMHRASQTAAAVLRHNPNARLMVNPGFNPLAQGELEGQPVDKIQHILKYFVDHPDQKFPGVGLSGVSGESINDHARRVGRAVHHELTTLRRGERKLILGHNSTVRWLHGWKKEHFPASMKSDPSEMGSNSTRATAEPAGEIIRLVKRGGTGDLEENSLDNSEPIKPGLHFARHGSTPFNGQSVLGKLGKKRHPAS